MSRCPDTIVLKFGSSVLADESCLPRAVHEIYRHLRRGRRVIAVVSALGSATDELLAHASRFGAAPAPSGVAALVATGEAHAVALMTLALDRAGIPANALDAGAIALRTRGAVLDAAPEHVDPAAIRGALLDAPVVVLPGFVGRDHLGRATLLGRGGSDFSAIYIAAAFGCDCVLVKDVPGLFDRDPATAPRDARRLARAAYDDVLALSEGIIQHKAVRFAKEHGTRVDIGAVGLEPGTRIDHGPTTYAGPPATPLTRRVLILGLGTVGLGVAELVRGLGDGWTVSGAAVRDPLRPRGRAADGIPLWTDPLRAVEECPCDVVAECLGGVDPASEAMLRALALGKGVVSANKAAVAARLPRLRDAAARPGASLRFSAAVGGAVPVLERLDLLRRDGRRVRSVRGVVNGTTNYILDRLHAGLPFDRALREARDAGFAEADPSADIDGLDAARKLALVADAAFGGAFDPSRVEGIRLLTPAHAAAARAAGRTLRLVAAAERDGDGPVRLTVAPEALPDLDPLASCRDEWNAIQITLADGSTFVLRGRGAGRYPTAQAVVGDLLDWASAAGVGAAS